MDCERLIDREMERQEKEKWRKREKRQNWMSKYIRLDRDKNILERKREREKEGKRERKRERERERGREREREGERERKKEGEREKRGSECVE